MTLSYQDVVKADLRPFTEAVAKWRVLPGQFETIGQSFANYVVKGLKESDWRGNAATTAFENMATAKRQIHDAAQEAKSIHGLLSDALEAFTSAQSGLRKVAEQVAEEKSLRITSAGKVTIDASAEGEVSVAAERERSELAAKYNARIAAALKGAQTADITLHWALTQDHNGHQAGFNADTHHSLRSATQARKQAVKDVEIATELASSSEGLTTEQLRQLDRILAKRQGDPLFSEQFAVRTGASGVLSFWSRQVRASSFDPDRTALLRRLQESVSHTLATATQSDSAAMRKWEREMIEQGHQKVDSYDNWRYDPLSPRENPYGYQVMSSLMRHGDFDTDFVTEYGKGLIEFDRGMQAFVHPAKLSPLENYPNWSFLEDNARDPLPGYLEALSHNPDAAQQLFRSPGYEPGSDNSEPNEELSYLLTQRDWSFSEDYQELGDALKAATLGVSPEESGLNRDWGTNNVAAQVMSMVADDEEILQNKPQLVMPMADIGAGYMDALNWAQAKTGGAADALDRDTLFGESTHHFPQGGFTDLLSGEYQLLRLPEETAHAFLTTVGQHSGGYEVLSNAQYLYTVGTMDRFGDEPDLAQGALNTGAYNQGALDNSRFSAIAADYNEISEEAAEKLEEATTWKSFGLKSVVMVGEGVLSGVMDGLAEEVVVPIVSEGAKTAIDTYVVDNNEPVDDFSKEKAKARRQFMVFGGERSKDPVTVYAERHDLPLSDENTWNINAMNSHHRGWDSIAEVD